MAAASSARTRSAWGWTALGLALAALVSRAAPHDAKEGKFTTLVLPSRSSPRFTEPRPTAPRCEGGAGTSGTRTGRVYDAV